MSETKSRYELPPNIDRYLATISKVYGQEGKRQLQQIIVNAKPHVREEWSIDSWNGGTYGHALYLRLPEQLFFSLADQKPTIQEIIKDDLNQIHNIKDEYIEQVFLEMDASPEHDWRSESGLLIGSKRQVSRTTAARIWAKGNYRVFLSHKSNSKEETGELKDQLKLFGISAFVAHEDIHPTKQWQEEIEQALASMDAFVALMTPDFHESDWTDQEVGYAFARGVPIIAANLGKLPYGFIGKFQALKTIWSAAAVEIAKLLIVHDAMLNAYIEALDKCPSFNDGNILSKLLSSITSLTPSQADKMIAANNENYELRESFGFRGTKPSFYGLGLANQLSRLDTTRRFVTDNAGLIRVVK